MNKKNDSNLGRKTKTQTFRNFHAENQRFLYPLAISSKLSSNQKEFERGTVVFTLE
jgi:hypothetical protein